MVLHVFHLGVIVAGPHNLHEGIVVVQVLFQQEKERNQGMLFKKDHEIETFKNLLSDKGSVPVRRAWPKLGD